MPRAITADTNYGSDENYQYFEDTFIGAFVKYRYFDKEKEPWNNADIPSAPINYIITKRKMNITPID